MMKATKAGDHWLATPSYEPGEIAFGFGELRHSKRLLGEIAELVLKSLTVAEAREIAADLIATADYIEGVQQPVADFEQAIADITAEFADEA